MCFDFDVAVQAPFRIQPGLRRLPPGAGQLTPVVPGSSHLREKLAVLTAHADQALCRAAGFDPQPALDALCRHAATEHPSAWIWDGRQARAPALGLAVVDGQVRALHPLPCGEARHCLQALPADWRLAGLLSLAFAEDFAVLDARDTRVPWLAVALPSHWAPEQKVGRTFAEVHAPVADNALLVGAAEALSRLVAGEQRWERFVWTITPHGRLHAHPQRVPPDRWAGVAVGDAWWRTERQTFIPVPGRQQAVFTIRVDLQPLAEAIDTPQRATRLHDALASMSPAVLGYRGLTPVRADLLAWLVARR
ncbi:heme-dependent oxidative N-demethylase subunit alpha family protein [Pseudorhodoferax sp. Leaf267]|uniref:heme-dependent oxidative N-demethylase subunit alpha family protein n=1 Tax=Pseudorhodoferax sp. Leaf267 TaxID=1736316 RepID=UPI0006FC209F|nr:heme-dependent oxidative N-demethylase subunit alpha family protein [Pseudorhodoferax sp. Leaf267]KQP22547.1 hypothetical protein ASF43_01070 [Pseudorhodoferax sp. Leaf267]